MSDQQESKQGVAFHLAGPSCSGARLIPRSVGSEKLFGRAGRHEDEDVQTFILPLFLLNLQHSRLSVTSIPSPNPRISQYLKMGGGNVSSQRRIAPHLLIVHLVGR